MSVWNAPTAMNDRRQYLQSRWCRPRRCAAVAVMIATVFLAVSLTVFLSAPGLAVSPISSARAAEPEVGVGAETKLPMTSYPNMKKYFDYVQSADMINIEKFFSELQQLEDHRYAALIVKPIELELVRRSKSVNNLTKMAAIAHSPQEWAYKK